MRSIRSIGAALALPIFLAALFVLQNELFNYWVGLYPNPFVTISLAASLALRLILFAPAALMRGWYRHAYLITMTLLSSLLLTAQYVYHSYFGGFLEASALHYAMQAGSEGGTIVTLLNIRLLIFFIGFFLAIAAAYLAWRMPVLDVFQRLTLRESAIAVVICAVCIAGGYATALQNSPAGVKSVFHPALLLSEMNRFTWSPDTQVEKLGVANFYLSDVIGSFFRRYHVTADDLATVNAWLNTAPSSNTAAPQHFGMLRGRNLIFIQVESLENAVIGKKIGGHEITPNLNALAKQGLYFNNYYTQIGPGNTADAEFVTLNSLYPLANTVVFIDYANNTYSALPKLLDSNGYHTYVLHDDVPDFWNRTNMYPSLGYETVISKNDFTPHGDEIMGGVGDRVFFDQAAQKMTAFQQPFMATLITISSHTPFEIPQNLQTLSIPASSSLTDTQKNYLISVHYADAAIGAFIANLKREGLYDNSLIAIYGDHGSFTGISDQLDSAQYKATAFADLRTNNVPLILLAPGTSLRGINSEPGSHLDLYPTVANLLGVQLMSRVFGRDLLNTKTPVETHVDPDTAGIRSILTPSLAFSGGNDGIFESGSCFRMPGKVPTELSDCESLFNKQQQAVSASEIVVRKNLVHMLSTASTTGK